MKNLILGFVMLLVTVSFANSGEPVKVLPVVPTTTEKIETVVVNEKKVADDAIYCSVVIDSYRHSCWFCDCAEFVKALAAVQ